MIVVNNVYIPKEFFFTRGSDKKKGYLPSAARILLTIGQFDMKNFDQP